MTVQFPKGVVLAILHWNTVAIKGFCFSAQTANTVCSNEIYVV